MIDDPLAQSNEPWQLISNAQEFDKIHREINRLPKRYRDVIVLCHLQGRTRSEAADLLNTTTSTVKAALARARNLLRQRLVRQGIVVTALITALGRATTAATDSTREPLLESTLQLCRGAKSPPAVGSTTEFVHSIATSGAQTVLSRP